MRKGPLALLVRNAEVAICPHLLGSFVALEADEGREKGIGRPGLAQT